MRGPQPTPKRDRLRWFHAFAANADKDQLRILWLDRGAIGGRPHCEIVRRRVEHKPASSQLPVESLVAQDGRGPVDERTADFSTPLTLEPTHLEEVREIAVELDSQAEIDGAVAMIADGIPLISDASPKKDRTHNVEHVFRQDQTVLKIHVRVGEVGGDQRVVVAHVRPEQQRLHAIEKQFQA